MDFTQQLDLAQQELHRLMRQQRRIRVAMALLGVMAVAYGSSERGAGHSVWWLALVGLGGLMCGRAAR